jgi:hypothetical protein
MKTECPICYSGTLLYEGKLTMDPQVREHIENHVGIPMMGKMGDGYVCTQCRRRFIVRNGKWTVMGVLPMNEPLPGSSSGCLVFVVFIITIVLASLHFS